jgi:hypothetical protein
MAKYKVGDKVKIKTGVNLVYHDKNKWRGKVMTIRAVNPMSKGGCYYDMVEDAHEGLEGDGWAWSESVIDGVVFTKKLIVTTDGETTTAKLIDGKQTIKTATAKCSKDDEFCFETGAQIAVDRLLRKRPIGKKPVEPEKPKFTKADLKDGMFGFSVVHDGEDHKWFVVCGGSLIYETGGFDLIKELDGHMKFGSDCYGDYGYVGAVIDGAVSFDNAKTMHYRHEGIVYERK